jgi:hypothetical protein
MTTAGTGEARSGNIFGALEQPAPLSNRSVANIENLFMALPPP